MDYRRLPTIYTNMAPRIAPAGITMSNIRIRSKPDQKSVFTAAIVVFASAVKSESLRASSVEKERANTTAPITMVTATTIRARITPPPAMDPLSLRSLSIFLFYELSIVYITIP